MFQAHVDDYNITAKCMCTEALGFKKGVCQDVHTGGTQNNQIQSFTDESGIFRVIYRRQLSNSQDFGDNPINEEALQYARVSTYTNTLKGGTYLDLGSKIQTFLNTAPEFRFLAPFHMLT